MSHGDPELIRAVREGRKTEFAKYNGGQEPPDAQDEQTFKDSVLQWEARNHGNSHLMLTWFKRLIQLRKTNPVLQNFNKNDIRAAVIDRDVIVLQRKNDDIGLHLLCVLNFSEKEVPYILPDWKNEWFKILDSLEDNWTVSQRNETTTPPRAPAGERISIAPLNVIIYSSADNG